MATQLGLLSRGVGILPLSIELAGPVQKAGSARNGETSALH